MKKFFTLNYKHLLAICVVVIFLFALYEVLLNRHYQKLKHQASSEISSVKVLEDHLIETSLLPLSVKYKNNLKEKNIPAWGGAIAMIRGHILLMDGRGQFYKADKNEIKSLSFRAPNDFAVLLRDHPDNQFGLRATSFVFEEQTHKLYVVFNKYISKNKVKVCVSSIHFDPNTFETLPKSSWETIFESQVFGGNAWKTSESSGGKILLKDDFLYLTIGYPIFDGFKTEIISEDNANNRSRRGVVIRINTKTLKSSLFAQGFRNSQGLAFDNNNYLIATEHGPQGGDEINLIEEGADYGWPFQTFGTVYATYDNPLQYLKLKTTPSNFKDPMFSFVPSVGLSAIFQVKTFNKRWQGDLLLASMKAETLYHLKYKNQKILYVEPIKIGHRIRDILEDGNKLILLTDDPYLIELKVDEKILANNEKKIN